MKIPLLIRLLAIPIKIIRSKENIAEGKIEKFKFVKSDKNKFSYNQQTVTFEDGYDCIWRHIKNDWFKQIGKWPEQTC